MPNPSFEIHSGCPSNQAQLWEATGWKSFGASPDYFNSCATYSVFSVPNNLTYQQASTGLAYSGLYTYDSLYPNAREFIGIKLTSDLVIGTTYYLSFNVNLLIDTTYGYNCATSGIGMKFSTVAYDSVHSPILDNSAHLFSGTIVSDTMNWIKISGAFLADSAYKYVMIGNFFDSTHFNNTKFFANNFQDPIAYYFIDDIYVSTTPLSVSQFLNSSEDFNLFPNPCKSELSIISPATFINKTIGLYDHSGALVKMITLDKKSNKIYVGDLEDGFYYLKTSYPTYSSVKKLIINKNP